VHAVHDIDTSELGFEGEGIASEELGGCEGAGDDVSDLEMGLGGK